MKRPVIGITTAQDLKECEVQLDQEYIDGVVAGGGVPLVLPSVKKYEFIDEYLEMVDGVLLSGGVDICPMQYGEESLAGFKVEWEMTPERDGFEIALCRKAIAAQKAVFGICRGIQAIAVACGGDLYQDIDTMVDRSPALRHFQDAPQWHPSHGVEVKPGSRLYEVYGKPVLSVNSLHHQAIRKVPEGFTVTARARDGIIEAIEAEGDVFVLGVQWHPESLLPRDGAWAALFAAFVRAAAGK